MEIKTSSVEGRHKTRKIITKEEYEIYKKNGILARYSQLWNLLSKVLCKIMKESMLKLKMLEFR